MSYDIEQVIKMSQAELDELFSSGEVGEIPNGEAKGTAIIAPGTAYNNAIAQAINFFAWQGKIFDAESGTLKNEVRDRAASLPRPFGTALHFEGGLLSQVVRFLWKEISSRFPP